MKIFTLILFSTLLPLVFLAQSDSSIVHVYFKSDEITLDEGDIKTLLSLKSAFNESSDGYEVELTGFADLDGDFNYNLILSQNRIDAVAEILIEELGVPLSRISSVPQGEIDQGGSSVATKEENRRVTLVLIKNTEAQAQKERELLGLPNPCTKITLTNSQGVDFRTSRGTRVMAPTNAFVNAAGEPVEGEVQLEITEALNPLEWMDQGLSCETEDGFLVSGGMVKLMATDTSGDEVFLDSSRPVNLEIPTQQQEEGMSVYYSKDGRTWEKDEAPFEIVDNRWPVTTPSISQIKRLSFFDQTGRIRWVSAPEAPAPPSEPVLIRDCRNDPINIKWTFFKSSKRIEQETKRILSRREAHHRRVTATYKRAKIRYENRQKRFVYKQAKFEKNYEKYLQDVTVWDDFIKWSISQVGQIEGRLPWRYQKDLANWWTKYIALDRIDEANVYASVAGDSSTQAPSLVYTASIANLGWINCDRMWSFPPETLTPDRDNIVVKNEAKATIALLIEGPGTLVAPFRRGRKMVFLNIPRGLQIQIVGYKVVDDELYLAQHDLGVDTEVELQWRKASLDEIQRIFPSV